jgi:hypothetical protein
VMQTCLRSLPGSQGVRINPRSQRVRRQCWCLKRACSIGSGSGLGLRVLASAGCALLCSDILHVQLPRYEIDLRVGVQGLLDDELCVACGRHCFVFVGWVWWNSNNTVEVLITLDCNIYRGCY